MVSRFLCSFHQCQRSGLKWGHSKTDTDRSCVYMRTVRCVPFGTASLLFGSKIVSVWLLFERVVVIVPNEISPIYLVFARLYTQIGILVVIDI